MICNRITMFVVISYILINFLSSVRFEKFFFWCATEKDPACLVLAGGVFLKRRGGVGVWVLVCFAIYPLTRERIKTWVQGLESQICLAMSEERFLCFL
jgi:hypothetical protein